MPIDRRSITATVSSSIREDRLDFRRLLQIRDTTHRFVSSALVFFCDGRDRCRNAAKTTSAAAAAVTAPTR